ncbi:MAG TPA: 4-hydroxyphenylacetate 3-hydroxylase N-terminal domain-containing protein [Dehalococcoidia bacterium]|jgi:anthranilate 3-monooxygenase (FAD)/4-hydroxyphenylacetate 3-monooxygenase
MPARTGAQYLDSLRRLQPVVYLGGRRVPSVVDEPVFQGTIEAIAQLYDLQHDPRYRDFMLFPSPTTGDPVHVSFQVPRSKQELVNKRKAFKLRTDQNFGFMGRTMDFMNGMVTGWYINRAKFARRGDRFGDNAGRYYEHVRENDLFLTHVLINPQIDRSRTSAEQEEPFLHLGKVGETKEGIVVRGAKMLGTMAPITEELVCFPWGGGVAEGDDAYAVGFAIANDTPGLKYICREPVAPPPHNRFDHPLSSRFEEMDCIAVFDDVLVPWDRVVIDGGPGAREVANDPTISGVAIGGQTAARMLSQMEFFCGLALKLADAIGITGFLHIQEKLGEMLSNLEVARAVFYGSEAMAVEGPDGVWAAPSLGPRAFHLQTMRIYRRFVEIVQLLGAGGFFYAPTRADFDNPEERPFIDRYVRGKPGVSAEERVRLFKLAWDVTGSGFAQRMQQYVTFYSGDPVRLTAAYYVGYDKDPLTDIVGRALGDVPDLDIPVSPDEPGRPQPRRSPAGGIAAQYPEATQPRPTRPRD